MKEEDTTPDAPTSAAAETEGDQIESPGEDVQIGRPLPEDIAITTGDETKNELEKRKLRLELLDLTKPWWRRPQSIAAMVALVAAIGGWITTAIYSNLDAKLTLLELKQEIAELEKSRESLTDAVAQLERQRADLFKSLAQEPAQVDPTKARTVTGQVIDEGTGLPIPGVVIEAGALDEELGVVRAVTDTKGQFTLIVPDVTPLRVTATKPGFVPFPAVRDVKLNGEETSIQIGLLRSTPPL